MVSHFHSLLPPKEAAVSAEQRFLVGCGGQAARGALLGRAVEAAGSCAAALAPAVQERLLSSD